MKNFLSLLIFILFAAFFDSRILAVPLEVEGSSLEQRSDPDNSSRAAIDDYPSQTDLVAAAAEPGENIGADQTADANSYDPNIYAGIMSPDVFRQYVSQFGSAYTPYAATYPAPYSAAVGYAAAPPPPPPPPAYANPYVVQTGYDGFLVPTTNTVPSSTSTSASTFDPLTYLRSLIPNFMLSTIVRILAAIASAVGVIFFGGAITTAVCSLTPICDISFKAVTYMRRSGAAEGVSKAIAEEMTPERVRRASEFVWKAIRKYNALQKSFENND